jgi:hypothetical protein
MILKSKIRLLKKTKGPKNRVYIAEGYNRE